MPTAAMKAGSRAFGRDVRRYHKNTNTNRGPTGFGQGRSSYCLRPGHKDSYTGSDCDKDLEDRAFRISISDGSRHGREPFLRIPLAGIRLACPVLWPVTLPYIMLVLDNLVVMHVTWPVSFRWLIDRAFCYSHSYRQCTKESSYRECQGWHRRNMFGHRTNRMQRPYGPRPPTCPRTASGQLDCFQQGPEQPQLTATTTSPSRCLGDIITRRSSVR